jgi:hypothetical protein
MIIWRIEVVSGKPFAQPLDEVVAVFGGRTAVIGDDHRSPTDLAWHDAFIQFETL